MKKAVIDFNLSQRDKKMPDFRSGDVVKIHRKIVEGGKEIKQIFEGIIIAVKGGQSSSPMITVRKVSKGVGVELILPVFSPNISKIEVVKRAKVRRAKLYYIRDKSAKSLKMKYKDIANIIADEPEAAEEPKAAEVASKEEK
jgi:large subunit ribosomal protein L19